MPKSKLISGIPEFTSGLPTFDPKIIWGFEGKFSKELLPTGESRIIVSTKADHRYVHPDP